MIIRANHADNYVTISNDALRDDRISLAARGLLAYMLTMSDGWTFTVNALSQALGVNRCTIIKYINELSTAGYIDIEKTQNASGHFSGSKWTINETPVDRSRKTPRSVNSTTVTPKSKNTVVGKTVVGNFDHIRNTNNKKYQVIEEIPKSINTRTREKFTPPTLEDVKAYCQERQNNVDPERWFNYYTSNGWKVGRNSMKDWKAAVRTWERSSYDRPSSRPESSNTTEQKKIDAALQIALSRAEGGNV